jgi:flotillin
MVVQFVAMFAVLAVYASRYKKVAPDRAMVVYGRKMHPGLKIGYQVITGGGKFLVPIIEDVKYMDLGLKDVILELDSLRTDPTEGSSLVRLYLTAIYRISADPSGIHVACEQLLDKTGEDIKRMVEVTIEGHARGIVATMTSKDIDLNRDEFEKKLRQFVSMDLLNAGIDVKAIAIIRVHRVGGS